MTLGDSSVCSGTFTVSTHTVPTCGIISTASSCAHAIVVMLSHPEIKECRLVAWLGQSILSGAQPVSQVKGPENVMGLDIKGKIYSTGWDLGCW